MNPYRRNETTGIDPDADGRAEQRSLLWVWLGIGLLLVVYDAGRPGPWGAVGSVGMLMSFFALKGLFGPCITRLRSRGRRGRS
ncbi:hypothetical protein [Polyangium fumosum]|uniref:Uncharacterized protein n=1 Tax=Polyangium fumosum TaxID=889272 RepID=A0A4U1IW52_9BACT|nr:hypothetical protein [Polyangium fumosum]TKC98715.1 hypothetical protein E8A74_40130 [Polyangium fumosum]